MENSKRYLSVDFLKALGVIYMVVLHQIIWVFIEGDVGGLRYEQSYSIIINLSRTGLHVLSMQLPVLAGLTFFLAIRNKVITWFNIFKRALLLVSLGFLKNYLAWGVACTFDWDVLPFIALSMVVSYPFIKKPAGLRGFIGLIILAVISLFFSNRFPLPAFRDSYLYLVFFGDARGQNYWPFCPWFSIFSAGIIIGHVLSTENRRNISRLLVSGVILFTISVFSGKFLPAIDASNIWGPSVFKPSWLFVLGIIGFSLISIPAAYLFFQHSPRIRQIFKESILSYYARGILWIYLLTIIADFRLTDFLFTSFNISFKKSLVILPFLTLAVLFFSYLVGRLVFPHKKAGH